MLAVHCSIPLGAGFRDICRVLLGHLSHDDKAIQAQDACCPALAVTLHTTSARTFDTSHKPAIVLYRWNFGPYVTSSLQS